MRLRSSTRPTVAVLSVVALGLTGCNDHKTASTAAPKPVTTASAAITQLVDALADGGSAQLRTVAAEAAVSSSAAAFLHANEYAALASEQAHAFQGQDQRATVTPQPSAAFKVCFPVADGSSPSCATYSRFLVDASGAVTSFSVDGQSIDGLAKLATSAPTTVAGAIYQARSSLKRPDGAVVVTVTVQAGSSELTLNAKQAELDTPDGLRQTADDAIAPEKVKPSTTTTFLMLFPPSALGGKVSLAPCEGACATTDHVTLVLT